MNFHGALLTLQEPQFLHGKPLMYAWPSRLCMNTVPLQELLFSIETFITTSFFFYHELYKGWTLLVCVFMSVHVHAHDRACGRKRSTLGVFLSHYPPYFVLETHSTRSSLIHLGWPTSFSDPPASAPVPNTVVCTSMQHHAWFYSIFFSLFGLFIFDQ